MLEVHDFDSFGEAMTRKLVDSDFLLSAIGLQSFGCYIM